EGHAVEPTQVQILPRVVRKLAVIRVSVQVALAFGGRLAPASVVEQEAHEILPRLAGVGRKLERLAVVHLLVTLDGKDPWNPEAAATDHQHDRLPAPELPLLVRAEDQPLQPFTLLRGCAQARPGVDHRDANAQRSPANLDDLRVLEVARGSVEPGVEGHEHRPVYECDDHEARTEGQAPDHLLD